MTYRKILVCDPVCAQPFGHNVLSLKYFTDELRSRAASVVAVAAHALPDDVTARYGFERAFDFYYHRHIRLPSTTRVELAEPDLPAPAGYVDIMEMRATRDMAALMRSHDIGAEDAIVLNSLDLYGALGLLNVVEAMSPERRPRCLLRFIGVMENATVSDAAGADLLLYRLRSLLAAGGPVSLCAETPRYANVLAAQLAADVHVVPYPVPGDPFPERPRTEVFNVVLPGSGRTDKGYLLLRELMQAVRDADPECRIRLTAQAMPPSDAIHHWRYTNQLGALPGVSLRPSSLTEAEMNGLYHMADLVLVPYDAETYRLRGSAVLMEAIARARPVLALDGPAFCDQLRYYCCGEVVSQAADLAGAILRASTEVKRHAHEGLLQARRRFMADASHAFDDWVSA